MMEDHYIFEKTFPRIFSLEIHFCPFASSEAASTCVWETKGKDLGEN